MQPSFASRKKLRAHKDAAFTLIELMVALAIIAILAALILVGGESPTRGPRSRAAAEIMAMSTALESYKTDNGHYPLATNLATNYVGNDATQSGGSYQISSQILYRALSGQTNFTDQPVADAKAYMVFKRIQVGNATGDSFVQDPSGNSYGYSTGTGTSYPYNGKGYFDLWSTAGTKGISTANTNSWISNWQ